MKSRRKLIFLSVMLVIVFLYGGCANTSKKTESLVGEWENEGGGLHVIFYDSGDYKDDHYNTGVYHVISDTELKIETKLHEYIVEYSLSGDTLKMDCGFMGKGQQSFHRE